MYRKRGEDMAVKPNFEEIEDFKNAMIFLFSANDKREFLAKQKENKLMKEQGEWITWKGRRVLLYNGHIYGGEVPPEWWGFKFENEPWSNNKLKALKNTIHYFLEEREEMIDQQLEVLESELKQGVSPYSYAYDDPRKKGYQLEIGRVSSSNPIWYQQPKKYYNWLSLSSQPTKKRIFQAIEKENEGRSQLYNDLKYLAHKILSEGDPVRDYPPLEKYQELLEGIQELKEEIFKKTDKTDKEKLNNKIKKKKDINIKLSDRQKKYIDILDKIERYDHRRPLNNNQKRRLKDLWEQYRGLVYLPSGNEIRKDFIKLQEISENTEGKKIKGVNIDLLKEVAEEQTAKKKKEQKNELNKYRKEMARYRGFEKGDIVRGVTPDFDVPVKVIRENKKSYRVELLKDTAGRKKGSKYTFPKNSKSLNNFNEKWSKNNTLYWPEK